MSVRSFVAVEVPDSIRLRLAGELASLRHIAPPARWTSPSSWHLTLAFLGELEAPEVAEVATRLAQVVAPLVPFELEISGAGTFPAARNARVAWIGCREQVHLNQLQQVVAFACDGLGQFAAAAGPFVPHLTLARCRPPWPASGSEAFVAAATEALGRVGVARWMVERVVLMSSVLEPGSGARHDVLAAFPLEGFAETGATGGCG